MTTTTISEVRKDVRRYVTSLGGSANTRYVTGRTPRHPTYWTVPSAHGPFQLETYIKPKYSILAIDRIIGALDVPEDMAGDWYRDNVWPVVRQALQRKGGSTILPTGGLFTYVGPVLTSDYMDVLTLVVSQEMAWQGQLSVELIQRPSA